MDTYNCGIIRNCQPIANLTYVYVKKSNLCENAGMNKHALLSWVHGRVLLVFFTMTWNSNDDELNEYVHLQTYTHSTINIHIQDQTIDNQDVSF